MTLSCERAPQLFETLQVRTLANPRLVDAAIIHYDEAKVNGKMWTKRTPDAPNSIPFPAPIDDEHVRRAALCCDFAATTHVAPAAARGDSPLRLGDARGVAGAAEAQDRLLRRQGLQRSARASGGLARMRAGECVRRLRSPALACSPRQ